MVQSMTTQPYFLNKALSGDRKSTRLNSSHRCISYAVFCLKKKKQRIEVGPKPPRIRREPDTLVERLVDGSPQRPGPSCAPARGDHAGRWFEPHRGRQIDST